MTSDSSNFNTGILSAVTEVPVLSQAFLRSASTQYWRVPAHFKPWYYCSSHTIHSPAAAAIASDFC